MSANRYRLAETISVYNADGDIRDQILFFEKAEALRRLFSRIPAGALMQRLPKLKEEYRKEVHIYNTGEGLSQAAEVAVWERGDREQLLIEYSTDYEL